MFKRLKYQFNLTIILFFKHNFKNSLELRNLWVQIYHTSDGLQFQTRNINKFKKINNCITGNELVEWLIRKKAVSRDQAIVIGQALCHGKWLECAYYTNINNNINNHQLFIDNNSFYKPGPVRLIIKY